MTKLDDSRLTVRDLRIFTALVLLLGWVGRLVDSLLGVPPGQGLGMLIWLLAPPLVSFLLRALAGDGWKDLGIRLNLRGNLKWYTVSLLVYPVVTFVILGAALALGGASMPSFDGGLFAQALVVGILPGILTSVEEFGWRGYFAPKLYTLGLNSFLAHALVGLVWGAWHLPYLSVFWGHAMDNLALFLPLFFLGAIAASIVYGEIRILTNSVWPAVLMHSVGNILLNTLIGEGFVQLASGKEMIFSPGVESVLSIALMACIGVGIYLVRRRSGAISA